MRGPASQIKEASANDFLTPLATSFKEASANDFVTPKTVPKMEPEIFRKKNQKSQKIEPKVVPKLEPKVVPELEPKVGEPKMMGVSE